MVNKWSIKADPVAQILVMGDSNNCLLPLNRPTRDFLINALSSPPKNLLGLLSAALAPKTQYLCH